MAGAVADVDDPAEDWLSFGQPEAKTAIPTTTISRPDRNTHGRYPARTVRYVGMS